MKGTQPTFLVVGAVKAGTTSLHEYLQQHRRCICRRSRTNHFSDADMDFAHFNVDYRQDIDHNLDKYLAGTMDHKIPSPTSEQLHNTAFCTRMPRRKSHRRGQ